MRKLILQMHMTVDAYTASLNGKMDWMVWNREDKLIIYVKKLSERVDCILLGSKPSKGFIP